MYCTKILHQRTFVRPRRTGLGTRVAHTILCYTAPVPALAHGSCALWVMKESPRGFELIIGGMSAQDGLNLPGKTNNIMLEGWLRGRRRRSRKAVTINVVRGFESPSLRNFILACSMNVH